MRPQLGRLDNARVAGEIVPRWEWRAFGEALVGAEERLAALSEPRVEESDELYLLSLDGEASVKVRDGLMDVKRREEVSAEGLERWRPVLKGEFPLAVADVATVLAAVGVDADPTAPLTLEQLLEDVVRPSERLRAVEVHKRRARFEADGVMAEATIVRAGPRSTRTVAVESTEPTRVLDLVRELGFEELPNVCVARGLKALVGFETPRFAVVDVGTNSVKLVVGEREPGGSWRSVADRAEVTRLGEGAEEAGRLGAEPMARTVEAVAGMVEEARRAGAAEVAAVGTAVLRSAVNAGELVDAVEERCGVRIQVVSGEEEARLAYVAATTALGHPQGALVVFDTGGGSSQFTFGQGGRVDERFSVPVGAVRIAERYGLEGVVDEEGLEAALAGVAGELTRLDGHAVPDAVVAMGGVLTNLAAVKHELADYDPEIVQGTVLDRAEIDRQLELYRTRSAEERRAIVGLQPKRAEVILAGACIVRTVLAKLGADSLTVSDRGLRHGLLAERFASS
jgi:exopolyphosphatase/guanosine-5'-triphosphate,3'-diphosphate pyrophosphatase